MIKAAKGNRNCRNNLMKNSMNNKTRIAVLDDYQHVALTMADWSNIEQQAEITLFHEHISAENAVIECLQPFDIVCVMRERTPLTRRILASLPNLKVIEPSRVTEFKASP